MKRILPVVLACVLIAAAVAWADGQVPGQVRSLFQKKCSTCHKGKFPPQGLSWAPDRIEAAIDAASSELPDLKIINSADPGASYVLKKVRGEKGIKGSRMPPTKALSPDEIKVLEDWITGLNKK